MPTQIQKQIEEARPEFNRIINTYLGEVSTDTDKEMVIFEPEKVVEEIWSCFEKHANIIATKSAEEYEEAVSLVHGIADKRAFDPKTGLIWQHWIERFEEVSKALSNPTTLDTVKEDV